MKFHKIYCLTIVLLAGCAAPAEKENMVPYADQLLKMGPQQKIHHKIKNIQVTGGSDTNPLWTSQVSNTDFQAALYTALDQAKILNDVGNLNLKVRLVALDQPLFGIGMTIHASVEYVINDDNTDKTIFDEIVNSSYTAEMSDSLVGVTRLRLANEGAIRNNIELLIKRLAQL